MSEELFSDTTEQQQQHTRFKPFDFEYDNDTSHDSITSAVEKKREYFTSNIILDYVKNAVSGKKYPYRLGTYESMRLYKVIDSTGRCDKDGFINKYGQVNKQSNILFYDSPEQYAKHKKNLRLTGSKHNELWQYNVNKWYNRNTRLFGLENGKFNKNEYDLMVKEGSL